ncbi:MAG: ABC transporter permease [Acidobacteria bacterium]|nr:ABC transporter permease [Acidobacteriota bacterium]
MHALAATLSLDFRLQVRNGFYYAVAFVLACWFVVLTRFPPIDWGYVLPAVVFGNLVMVNFYFVAGLVLLEKNEGTLEAQVVTPLADWQYLTSKTATLTALSLIEQVVIVWSAYGAGFAGGPLAAGIVLAAILYTLTGFVLVARYRSINEFLFPSVLFTTVLSLPLLHYFGFWDIWLLYLHPFTAPLVLLAGAFGPIPVWEWVYGVLYGAFWAGLLLLAARRAFDRHIVAREGSR